MRVQYSPIEYRWGNLLLATFFLPALPMDPMISLLDASHRPQQHDFSRPGIVNFSLTNRIMFVELRRCWHATDLGRRYDSIAHLRVKMKENRASTVWRDDAKEEVMQSTFSINRWDTKNIQSQYFRIKAIVRLGRHRYRLTIKRRSQHKESVK